MADLLWAALRTPWRFTLRHRAWLIFRWWWRWMIEPLPEGLVRIGPETAKDTS
jgi:hypothetical protein